MSAWHGPCHRGAMREHRDRKRLQAELRNELTEPRNRKVNRRRIKRTGKSPGPVTAPTATEAA